jgi:hypothetical protein
LEASTSTTAQAHTYTYTNTYTSLTILSSLNSTASSSTVSTCQSLAAQPRPPSKRHQSRPLQAPRQSFKDGGWHTVAQWWCCLCDEATSLNLPDTYQLLQRQPQPVHAPRPGLCPDQHLQGNNREQHVLSAMLCLHPAPWFGIHPVTGWQR